MRESLGRRARWLSLLALLALAAPGGGTAFRGANGNIAFTTNRDGNQEIYLVASGGGAASNRTSNPAADSAPVWSPDGTQIAFTSTRDGNGELYAMAATGGAATRLTTDPGSDDHAAWSPSGAQIAFTSNRDGDQEIYTMNADGSSVAQRTSNAVISDRDPAWSPSGAQIAFTSDRDGNDEIYVMDAGGSNVVRLTSSAGSDSEPAWAPDGTRIAFVSARDGNPEIYVMNADGSNQLRLTNNAFTDASPSWSPDGTRIAFALSEVALNDELYTMAIDGTQLMRLTTNAAINDSEPDWGASLANTVTPPAPSGATVEGATLTAQNGTWSGATPITYTYAWQRCNSSGSSCSAIGATGIDYTLTAADVGATIRVSVTATNSDGSATALSAPTGVIAALAPANTALPEITGKPMTTQMLTASPGSWNGSPPLTFTYQWQRCDNGGGACSNIGGATNSSYTVVAADEGSTMRVAVVASNASGASGPAVSAPTAVVVSPVPANTALPTVSAPLTIVGQNATSTQGTWVGLTPMTFTYQWQRCDAGGNSCVPIAGATASSYTIVIADMGSTLRSSVRATNTAGSTLAVSVPSSLIAAAPPDNTSSPVITGTLLEGQVLTTSNGVWLGTQPMTFTYQWKRCDVTGLACLAIGGATAPTYTVVAGDGGSTLRVTVMATNAGGTGSATSIPTQLIAVRPANTTLPSISGSAVESKTLTANPGVWLGGSANTLTYQWRRCDSAGASCSAITGATSTFFSLTSADVGSTLRVAVTATNAAGTASAVSNPTAVVTKAAPASLTAPAISGSAAVGQTVFASPGTWSGATPLDYAYQWQRCDDAGTTCTDVPGQTGASYVVASGDLGMRLRVVVTVTNSSGSASRPSGPTAKVTPAAVGPSSSVAPAITGTPAVGSKLSATTGTWRGNGTIAYAYQWERCSAAGSCKAISEQTKSTYTVTTADVGSSLRVTVTATDTTGSATAVSQPTATVVAGAKTGKLTNIARPTVKGSLVVGGTLFARAGRWSPAGARFSYRWQRCNARGTRCKTIRGATHGSYRLQKADLGHKLRLAVTAKSGTVSATAYSKPVGPVAEKAKPQAKRAQSRH